MTTQQMLDDISARTGGTGEGVITAADGLFVGVKILDARRSFDRIDILVTPLAGHGEKWVNVERLQRREEGGK